MLLLVPSIAYSGLSAAFIYAIYPGHIGGQWLGYGLLCFGGAEFVGSLVGGKLSDRIGRVPVFVFSVMATTAGVVSGVMSPVHGAANESEPASWLFFFSFFWLGMGDSGFNTQVQAAIGHFHPGSTSQSAFAFYRGVLSLFAAIGAIGGRWCTVEYFPDGLWDVLLPGVILWGSVVLALGTFLFLHFRVQSVDHHHLATETVDKVN